MVSFLTVQGNVRMAECVRVEVANAGIISMEISARNTMLSVMEHFGTFSCIY